MEYKPTNKTFTVLEMQTTSSIATHELWAFTAWMKEHDLPLCARIIVNEVFLKYVQSTKSNCFISWLIKQELVLIVEPETVYKHGDRFYFDGKVHILIRHKQADNYALACMETGVITDFNRIVAPLTLAEINKVWG